jgi:aryl-phospho-beta-D-glucosidase BglC (GH1 family)
MPFVEAAYAYVDQAMAWGVTYGLGVWLDLHAVAGSQNGFDSSAPLIAAVRAHGNCSNALIH